MTRLILALTYDPVFLHAPNTSDLAANTFEGGGCPGTCRNFVQSNPGAFSDAYWLIQSLKVYTTSGKSAATSGAGYVFI